MVNTRFTHCLFNLLGITRTDWFNLRKTNAANEWLVGRLSNGRKVPGGISQTYCLTHSNSLSNEMDNSLLDVRGINHKYIVVGLQSQQIDFAIIRIYEFTKDYFDPSVYGTIPLFDEPVYMILSPKLVKKGQVSISPEEIGRIPFFTAKEDGYTKYILEKLCMVCKCQIQNYNIRADDFSVLLSAVSEGKAETMAGKSIATRLREMYKGIYSVDFLPIKPSFSQCLQIIYLKDKKVSEREWKLIELLKKANG